MVRKECVTEACAGLAGGKGRAKLTNLLEKDELPKNAPLMAIVELEPGASVGYHKHEGEGEMYHLLAGSGDYTEDGVTTPVCAGMTTMVYDGHSHGLVNTGSEALRFVAVIVSE